MRFLVFYRKVLSRPVFLSRAVNEWSRTDPDLEVPESIDGVGSRAKINSNPFQDPLVDDEAVAVKEMQQRMEAKVVDKNEIPIDLFYELNRAHSKRENFFPFLTHVQRFPVAESKERQDAADRIGKIAELLMNLAWRDGLPSILDQVALDDQDMERLILELEFRGEFDLALTVLEVKSQDREMMISAQLCEYLICCMTKKGASTSVLERACGIVDQRGLRLDMSCYYSVGMAFIEDKKLDEGIRFLQTKEESRTLVDIYNRIFELCFAQGKPFLAFKLHHHMRSVSEISPTIQTYASLMSCAFRTHDDKLLFSYMEELKLGGLSPDLYMYNLLIKASERINDTQTAVAVMEELRRDKRIRPNVKTYNAMIRLYGRSGYLSKALDLFQELQHNGNRPSLLTFNAIINAATKTKQTSIAFDYFEQMIHEYQITPNTFTFTSLIRACYHIRDLQKSLDLLQEMKNRGLELDVMTFGALIHVCHICQDPFKAQSLFHEMLSLQISPNEAIKESLMKLCHSFASDPIGLALLEDMKRSGLAVDIKFYHMMLRACLHRGDEESCRKWKKQMIADGIEPTERTDQLIQETTFKHQESSHF